MPETLLQNVRVDQGTLIAEVTGSLHFDEVPRFRDEIFQQVELHQPKKLILDLAHVAYLGSSALSVFVELFRKLPPGSRLFLVHLQPEVLGVIQITRLETLLSIAPTLDEALRA